MPGGPPENADYEALLQEALERRFSAEELELALGSVCETCKPGGAMPNAVAAFEFLGFVGDFVATYAEQEGIRPQLSHALEAIHGMTLMSFGAAVSAELGTAEDIWRA